LAGLPSRMTIGIRGMLCATCVHAIEKSLLKLDGVSEASVNLAAGNVSITYDSAKTGRADFHRAIRSAGYEPIDTSRKTVIGIEGMTCASCVRAVEKALTRLDGVETAGVNLAANNAVVTYDPEKTSIADFKRAVAAAGYKAVLTTG
jgi:Cu+-exporting ATPase